MKETNTHVIKQATNGFVYLDGYIKATGLSSPFGVPSIDESKIYKFPEDGSWDIKCKEQQQFRTFMKKYNLNVGDILVFDQAYNMINPDSINT